MTKERLNNLLGKLRAFSGLLVTTLALPCVASESHTLHASHVGNLVLSFNGDRISAQIENESLQKILEELRKGTNIKIVISKFTDNQIISLSFEHLLLTDAFKKILWNRSYIFSTDGGGLLLRVLGNTG